MLNGDVTKRSLLPKWIDRLITLINHAILKHKKLNLLNSKLEVIEYYEEDATIATCLLFNQFVTRYVTGFTFRHEIVSIK
jgi:hypothetical protein